MIVEEDSGIIAANHGDGVKSLGIGLADLLFVTTKSLLGLELYTFHTTNSIYFYRF